MFPIAVAAEGALELIKFGVEVMEARNNGTLTQEMIDQKWAATQNRVKLADDRWIASKKSQGQA